MWRHHTVRFLPTQEWSTGERESIGEYRIVATRCCRRHRQIRQFVHRRRQQCQNTPTPLHSPRSSFLRKQESQRATPFRRHIWRHDTVRFLPTQEWSTGERESIGEYRIVAVAAVAAIGKSANCPPPPPTMPKYAHSPPFPHSSFLRKQESHSVVHANNGKIAHNPPYPTRPFLRRQESHNHGRQRRYESAAGGMPIVATHHRQNHPQIPAPHRPFLRRQESHFRVRQRRLKSAAGGKSWRIMLSFWRAKSKESALLMIARRMDLSRGIILSRARNWER